jgi:trehalose utilization protein
MVKEITALAWSERSEPENVYPDGINGAVAEGLNAAEGITASATDITMPEHGLTEEVLSRTDVLLWWGHKYHEEVAQEVAERIARHVRERGMGFVPIHSSHYSRPFRALMGTECGLGGWREDDAPESIHVVMPNHPIAKGVNDFVIPKTEMYNEPFAVPPPDALLLESRFEQGEYFRSGCCWTVDKGRVFYFRPGHETQPILYRDDVRRIIENAVRWVAKET